MHELQTLEQICTTDLDKSLETLNRMHGDKDWATVLFEKKEILLNGMLEMHKYFWGEKNYYMAERVNTIITKSFEHK